MSEDRAEVEPTPLTGEPMRNGRIIHDTVLLWIVALTVIGVLAGAVYWIVTRTH